MKLGNMTVFTAMSILSVVLTTAGSFVAIGSQTVDPTKKLSDVKLLPQKKGADVKNEAE